MSAGVRQGGVLSPNLYSIYVDNLINILKSSGVGCYISHVFAAALFYADDILIMAPSIRGLQKLLNICSSYCKEWDIGLNPKKSKNMSFGRKLEISSKTTIDGLEIEWVSKWKYLGVDLKSGPRFGCSVSDRVKRFYRALNTILRVEGRADNKVLLRLLEAHCVPVLTYAIEMTQVADRDEWRSLRVAYNSVFRKIYGYRLRDSVTNLQHDLGRPTWEELIKKRSDSFLRRARRWDKESLIRAFC